MPVLLKPVIIALISTVIVFLVFIVIGAIVLDRSTSDTRLDLSDLDD